MPLVQDSRRNQLFLVLGGIFITNALLAEIVGTKIFSLEKTLGVAPAQLSFFGQFTLDFNLTAGVLLWPVVFITTDIINEYFGKQGVRKISFITAGLIAYSFVVLWVVTKLVPADFWLNINAQDSAGNPLLIDEAFSKIFIQSLGIIIGSLTAFLIGQLVDVAAFQWLRKYTGSKHIWFRATGSTVISQFVDSFVVLGIAFYLLGNWSLNQVVAVGIVNYIYKFGVALLITPTLYLVHAVIDAYLGKDAAAEMVEEASQSKFF